MWPVRCPTAQPGLLLFAHFTVLQVLAVDPGQRGVSEGVPLMSGAPFLLQHCATKQVCPALPLLPACFPNFCPVLSGHPISEALVKLGKMPLVMCIQYWHDAKYYSRAVLLTYVHM